MYDTLRYSIASHFGGVLLTRTLDGATLFFQPGDDAESIYAELDTTDDDMLDAVCDQYADLFTCEDK